MFRLAADILRPGKGNKKIRDFTIQITDSLPPSHSLFFFVAVPGAPESPSQSLINIFWGNSSGLLKSYRHLDAGVHHILEVLWLCSLILTNAISSLYFTPTFCGTRGLQSWAFQGSAHKLVHLLPVLSWQFPPFCSFTDFLCSKKLLKSFMHSTFLLALVKYNFKKSKFFVILLVGFRRDFKSKRRSAMYSWNSNQYFPKMFSIRALKFLLQ